VADSAWEAVNTASDDQKSRPVRIQMPQVAIEGDRASELADTISLSQDFRAALQCCELLLSMTDADDAVEPDSTVSRSLWFAAVIAYRRAFTTGKAHLKNQKPRASVPDLWIETLHPDLKVTHDRVLKTANKHVAHRASNLEGVIVNVVLSVPPADPRAIAVLPLFLQYAGPERPEIERLARITRQFANAMESLAHRQSHLILGEANKSLGWFYSHATPAVVLPAE
jgi:hypothetical protein